jgi:hypothetical protein
MCGGVTAQYNPFTGATGRRFRCEGVPLKRADPGQNKDREANKRQKMHKSSQNLCVNRDLNFSLLKPPTLLALSFSSPSAGR